MISHFEFKFSFHSSGIGKIKEVDLGIGSAELLKLNNILLGDICYLFQFLTL
uniref:Uncharacterized protein n=1 Tax=Octopus bimaculoides TaxID=37653 RepID=A0A0L8G4A3_OCTBM